MIFDYTYFGDTLFGSYKPSLVLDNGNPGRWKSVRLLWNQCSIVHTGRLRWTIMLRTRWIIMLGYHGAPTMGCCGTSARENIRQAQLL